MVIMEVKNVHFCVFWWGYINSILCKQWWWKKENCFRENRQNIKWLIIRLGLSISLLGTLQHALGTALKYAENFTILQLCKCWCISRREGKINCHVVTKQNSAYFRVRTDYHKKFTSVHLQNYLFILPCLKVKKFCFQ